MQVAMLLDRRYNVTEMTLMDLLHLIEHTIDRNCIFANPNFNPKAQ